MPSFDIFFANAGCGKTSRLMDIIDKYVEGGVPLERIAFLTFTRKAAQVAQERAMFKFGATLKQLRHFRTIHSLAFRGTQATRGLMMDAKKYRDFGEKAGYEFSSIKFNAIEGIDWNSDQDSRLINAEQLYRANREYCEKIIDQRIQYSDLVRYMRLYTQYKQTFGYKDFTDLLDDYIGYECTEDVDIVCLDEMQDSSPLQWRVVFQAFRNASKIYIAADDKQCIYGFAGASASIVQTLRGTPHFLDVSYRVPSTILAYANNIAAEISDRVKMECRPQNQGGIVQELNTLDEISTAFHWDKKIFMLARNNRFLKDYVVWCQHHGVQYVLKGEPAFTAEDKLEFSQGKLDHWDKDKILFATDCMKHNRFYNTPNVYIDTIHGVKGDEADIVILMSDISRIVKNSMDIDENNEHRVFYVGTTRAREELYILQPQTNICYPYLFQ